MRGAALALLLAACHRGGDAEAPVRADDAAAGVHDPALRRLLVDHWRWTLARNPELATSIGAPGHDAEVSDRSLGGALASREARWGFLARADLIDPDRLDPDDRRWLRLFRDELDADLQSDVCRFELWGLSPRGNVMADLWGTFEVQPLADEGDAADWLARLQAFAARMDGHVEALRIGLREGLVANATSIRKTIDMVDAELAREPDAWGPSSRRPPEGAAWGAGFLAERRALLDGPVRAALVRWRDVLERELLPAARTDAAPGLATLPDGKACYTARIRAFTTLPLTPAELHATGLAELQRIHADFRRLGASVLGTDDLQAVFARLRTDPALRFGTREEVLAAAADALADAKAAVPAWFGHLPATDCVVAEIPAYEAPYTTIAYYRQPVPGVKPGEYFVNTWAPETRPRFEARALAFHEGIPGHHTQIALSYELPAAPAFHRYGGATAFVEGWGLYAERLADEIGLYPSDLDRLGMLSFDAWRAGRLVVDTGLHDLGWSRQQAERFLLENTPLAENNVVNEVDRYVTWPGQALAYKTGQLEILALRARAEAELGPSFDVRGFHDAVLGHGAVSLPLLRDQVEAWIAAVRGGSSR